MISLINGIISLFQNILIMSISAAVLTGIIILIRLTVGRWMSYRSKALLWLILIPVMIIPFSLIRLVDSGHGVAAPAAWVSVNQAVGQISAEPVVLETNAVEVTAPDNIITQPVTSTVAVLSSSQIVWLTVSLLWILGFTLLLLLHIVSYLQTQRRLQGTQQQLPTVWQDRFAAIIAKTSLNARSISLVQCSQNCSPYLIGLRRIRIAIPTAIAAQSDQEMVNSIIVHELTHLVHRDHLLRIVQCLLQSIHWFNPFCWFAVRLQQKDSEFYCDEKSFQHEVVVNRADYAQALLQTSKIISAQPTVQRTGLITPAFAETGLKLRIQKVLQNKPTHWLIAATATVLILLAAILILPSWMSPVAELERQQTEYIRQFNYEVYANQGLYRSYTLQPEIMNELSIRSVWGLQTIDPKQYYGKQIDEYMIVAQMSAADSGSNDFSKRTTCFYLMVADNKIIGGYRLPFNERVLAEPHSLTGMTLNGATGKTDQEWLDQWQADFGKSWTEPWPDVVQNPIRLQSAEDRQAVDQYLASKEADNPFEITPFDYVQLGRYTAVGLIGKIRSQLNPSESYGVSFLEKTAGELSAVNDIIAQSSSNNGSEDVSAKYAITYLDVPYEEHDMIVNVVCNLPNIARIELIGNGGNVLCAQNYDGGPAMMLYPFSGVIVVAKDGTKELEYNIDHVTFYDTAGNILCVEQ